jgi:hypothetical protein
LRVRVLQYQSLSRPAKDGKEATASVEVVTSKSGFAIGTKRCICGAQCIRLRSVNPELLLCTLVGLYRERTSATPAGF